MIRALKNYIHNPLWYFASLLILILSMNSCEEYNKVEYADGYPNKLAGNWIVFEFQGGNLEGSMSSPYAMVTALDPNTDNNLVIDNVYNSGLRLKAGIKGDTSFVAHKNVQLDVNKGGYGIERISIEGYIDDNPVLQDFAYRMAMSSFEYASFTQEQIEETILLWAGFYDSYNALVDTIMVIGYRKTGFEDVDYN